MSAKGWLRVLLAALALLTSACIENAPLDIFKPKGPFSQRANDLFWPVFWVAVVIFVLVEGAIVFMTIVFRDRGGKEAKQIHGNPKLEIVWTVIPALILAGIAVPTFRAVFDLTECGAGAMPVEVIGHQWWFEYRYPEHEITTANELVIPAGREVCASMTSGDVLHNYWIPALNGKRYLVPGQQTVLRLQADEPGYFVGQCAEFCGLSHSLMRARAIALPEEEFNAWVEQQKTPAVEPVEGSPAAAGKEEFLGGQCVQCHNIEGVNEVGVDQFYGPDLTHFAGRTTFAGSKFERTNANLKLWLANPPIEKPGSYMPNLGLTEEQIDRLIAYLETLQ